LNQDKQSFTQSNAVNIFLLNIQSQSPSCLYEITSIPATLWVVLIKSSYACIHSIVFIVIRKQHIKYREN